MSSTASNTSSAAIAANQPSGREASTEAAALTARGAITVSGCSSGLSGPESPAPLGRFEVSPPADPAAFALEALLVAPVLVVPAGPEPADLPRRDGAPEDPLVTA